MQRFTNILAAVANAIGDDDVIAQASALARTNGARLTLAAVIPDGTSLHWREEGRKRLLRLADAVRHAGVERVETRLLSGSTAPAITCQVFDGGHDLVITSRLSGKRFSDPLLGDSTNRLIKKCPCPVWALQPGQEVPFRTVLAITDASAGTDVDNPANRTVLRLASSLAALHGAELHLLHAWQVDGAALDTVRSEMQPRHRARLLDDHEERHRQTIERILDDGGRPACGFQLHLVRDTPANAIRAFMDERSIDVIVLGAGVAPGLPQRPGGTLTETLIPMVDSSFLVVRQDAFPATLPGSVSGDRAIERADALVTSRIA